MDRRKMAFIGVCVVLAAAFAFYFARRAPDVASPPQAALEDEVIGVLDLRRATRAHPSYTALETLRKERSALAASAVRARSFRMEETGTLGPQLASLNEALLQKRLQALKEKQAEANERLKQKEQVVVQHLSPPYEAKFKAVDDAYFPQIFNLQLKLDTLKLTPDAAQVIQKQMAALKAEHAQKTQEVQRAFGTEVAMAMRAEQQKEIEALDAYAAQLDAQLRDEAEKKQGEIAARNHLAAARQSQELSLRLPDVQDQQRQLAAKEKEIAALESAILQEVSAKTAQVAVARGLTAVLTGVRVNASALDVTDAVVETFRK